MLGHKRFAYQVAVPVYLASDANLAVRSSRQVNIVRGQHSGIRISAKIKLSLLPSEQERPERCFGIVIMLVSFQVTTKKRHRGFRSRSSINSAPTVTSKLRSMAQMSDTAP